MSLINRKAGVVIGLTVILTFPVTVVSGAGSQKKGESETRYIVTTHKVPVDRTGVIGSARPINEPSFPADNATWYPSGAVTACAQPGITR